MVSICEDKEDVLQDWNEELLEESIRRGGIGVGDVNDELQAHVETSIFDFPIVMLTCPHAGVDDKFELSVIELEECCMSSAI